MCMFYYLNPKDTLHRKRVDHLILLYNHSTLSLQEIMWLLDYDEKSFNDELTSCYRKGLLDLEFRDYPLSKGPKYYYYDYLMGKYRVVKTLDGRKVSFGYYASEDIARFVVRELKKCGWDKNELECIRGRVGANKK